MTNKTPFTIQNKSLIRYLRTSNAIGIVFMFLSIIFVPLILTVTKAEENAGDILTVLSIIGLVILVPWFLLYALYAKHFANSLKYELEGDILRISQGVFNWERKAIPMDRVTDVRMTQGILMRQFGIWRVDVQTASQGGVGAEGTLHAVTSPKFVRDTLLAARNISVNS